MTQQVLRRFYVKNSRAGIEGFTLMRATLRSFAIRIAPLKNRFARGVSAAALVTAVTVVLSFSAVTEFSLFKLSAAQKPAPTVSVYVTTADASLLFAQDAIAPQFTTAPMGKIPVISVNDHERFQAIDGFGAALTGSSAYVLANMPDHGAALLDELFRADTGIGLSYLRVSVGASDFSLGSYSYDDMAPGLTDPALTDFSVARDADMLSLLQKIRATSKDVRFMASPWTAPAWMKTSQRLFGGRLRPNAYGDYARYLVAYVRALQDRGIALDALTPQNEPLLDVGAYPSMTLSASEETVFVRTALGPALRAAFPATKLVVNDHNWEGEAYPLAVLRDADAARYIAGSAFHCYAGNVRQMSSVQRAFPSKAVYLDECSGGNWSPNFRDNLGWDMRNLIIGGTANWARTVLLGNLALDDAAGPTNGGCANCRGVVTVHSDGSVTRNVEYYVLEHATKFVRPGAVRIASSSPRDTALPNVAFINVDGSKVLLVFNASSSRISFAVRFGAATFRYSLRSGSIATFRWT